LRSRIGEDGLKGGEAKAIFAKSTENQWKYLKKLLFLAR
jgi:hypothetical protein